MLFFNSCTSISTWVFMNRVKFGTYEMKWRCISLWPCGVNMRARLKFNDQFDARCQSVLQQCSERSHIWWSTIHTYLTIWMKHINLRYQMCNEGLTCLDILLCWQAIICMYIWSISAITFLNLNFRPFLYFATA